MAQIALYFDCTEETEDAVYRPPSQPGTREETAKMHYNVSNQAAAEIYNAVMKVKVTSILELTQY